VRSGVEECEPPGTATCANNCLFKTTGGGGGGGGGDDDDGLVFDNKDPFVPPEGCGDGIIDVDENGEPTEECDSGRFNGLGYCSLSCTLFYCGDGVVSNQIGEECEPEVITTGSGSAMTGSITFVEPLSCGDVCSIPEYDSQTETYIGGCQLMILPQCTNIQSGTGVVTEDGSTCGNGIREGLEECDYGSVCLGGDNDGILVDTSQAALACETQGGVTIPQSGDGCSDVCELEFCGDGVIQEFGADGIQDTADDEECDNGNLCNQEPFNACKTDADCSEGQCEYNDTIDPICSSSCKIDQCGDGALQVDEICDDGNKENGDGCSANCLLEEGTVVVCGDGILTSGEECDDDNEADGDGCSSSCLIEQYCGNGIVSHAEECDDGNNAAGDGCSPICEIEGTQQHNAAPGSTSTIEATPYCGDGTLDSAEQCDNGIENSDTAADACRTTCINSSCGDYVLDAGEQCDNGAGNSSVIPDRCRKNCRLPFCGDGIIDTGEQCDGSLNCRSNCTLILSSVCGNGVEEYGESCDDGNLTNGDGCNNTCQIEENIAGLGLCGNGIVEASEECDDGNNDDEDGCTYLCKTEKLNLPIVDGHVLQSGTGAQHPAPVTIELPSQGEFVSEYIPTTPEQAPIGETGPAAVLIVISGAAAGLGWMRRKRRAS